jgi:hypothetical protein
LNDSDYLSVSVNQYASHMQKFADIYIRRPSVCRAVFQCVEL